MATRTDHATDQRTGTTPTTRSPAQLFAYAFGIVYLLVGLVGFAVTGFNDWFANGNEALIIFEINPAHNIVHLLLGAAFLYGARSHRDAKLMNSLLGAAFLVVFVIGAFGGLQWLSVDNQWYAPDNWLHLLSGLGALFFGTVGAERSTNRTTAR